MGNPVGVKRDFDALEERRLEAVGLLKKGKLNYSQNARQLKVCRQTVSRWAAALDRGGQAAMKKAGRAGRKPRLKSSELLHLVELLKKGPEAVGYKTPLSTCWRVTHLVKREFQVNCHPGHVWKILDGLGWSCQRPVGRARERNEAAIREWKQQQWPATKKKARQEGQTIVFVDESGVSQRPHRGADVGAQGADARARL
jgi:transposase